MKNALKSSRLISCFLLLLFVSMSSFSQNKSDVVVMLNGEKKVGKVKAINDENITFIYADETLEYKIKKTDIDKIIFASGRTQEFSNKPQKTTVNNNANPATRKGKMAVLPFKIITNMPSVDKDAFGKKIQIDCVNTIKNQAPTIEVIDPRVVNVLLAKNNITSDQLQNKLPKELAELLGVEHVVFGTYEIQRTGTTSYVSSVTTYKSNRDKNADKDKKKGIAINSGSSSTRNTFDSRVTLDIYNDQGSNIYSVSRKPFSAGLDKYHSTIKYLIKRAPFRKK